LKRLNLPNLEVRQHNILNDPAGTHSLACSSSWSSLACGALRSAQGERSGGRYGAVQKIILRTVDAGNSGNATDEIELQPITAVQGDRPVD
jgi:hypothetical protein